MEGACLCGEVRFRLVQPPQEIALCHCSQCRRANGGAFNVAVPVAADAITWLARDSISERESSPGKVRAFCSGCGAPIYSRLVARPGTLRLRGGLIDWQGHVPASIYHIHWDDRLAWFQSAAADTAPRWPQREPGA